MLATSLSLCIGTRHTVFGLRNFAGDYVCNAQLMLEVGLIQLTWLDTLGVVLIWKVIWMTSPLHRPPHEISLEWHNAQLSK